MTKAPAPKKKPATPPPTKADAIAPDVFVKEYWTGDSRDGLLTNGDGYHFYRMNATGRILEAYEYYETDDGVEVVCPLPEMLNVNWYEDLGFEDKDALDSISEDDFSRVKELMSKT